MIYYVIYHLFAFLESAEGASYKCRADQVREIYIYIFTPAEHLQVASLNLFVFDLPFALFFYVFILTSRVSDHTKKECREPAYI